MNDLKRILFLVLLKTISIISTNIDCNGKPFHCVNSTHFLICVDLGGGVSITIDDYVIPCPRATICDPNNRFECEYPKTTTVSPLEVLGVTKQKESKIGDGTTTTRMVSSILPENVTPVSISTVTSDVTTLLNVDLIENIKLDRGPIVEFAPEISTININNAYTTTSEANEIIGNVKIKSTHESMFSPSTDADSVIESPLNKTGSNIEGGILEGNITLNQIYNSTNTTYKTVINEIIFAANFFNASKNGSSLINNLKPAENISEANTFTLNSTDHNLQNELHPDKNTYVLPLISNVKEVTNTTTTTELVPRTILHHKNNPNVFSAIYSPLELDNNKLSTTQNKVIEMPTTQISFTENALYTNEVNTLPTKATLVQDVNTNLKNSQTEIKHNPKVTNETIVYDTTTEEIHAKHTTESVSLNLSGDIQNDSNIRAKEVMIDNKPNKELDQSVNSSLPIETSRNINVELSPIHKATAVDTTERVPQEIYHKTNISENHNNSQPVRNNSESESILTEVTMVSEKVNTTKTQYNQSNNFTTTTEPILTKNNVLTNTLDKLSIEATFTKDTHEDTINLRQKLNHGNVSNVHNVPNENNNTELLPKIKEMILNTTDQILAPSNETSITDTPHYSNKTELRTITKSILTDNSFITKKIVPLPTEAPPIQNPYVNLIRTPLNQSPHNSLHNEIYQNPKNCSPPLGMINATTGNDNTSEPTKFIVTTEGLPFNNRSAQSNLDLQNEDIHSINQVKEKDKSKLQNKLNQNGNPEISAIINKTVYNITEQFPLTTINDTSETKFSEVPNISQTETNSGPNISFDTTSTMIPLQIPDKTTTAENNKTEFTTITAIGIINDNSLTIVKDNTTGLTPVSIETVPLILIYNSAIKNTSIRKKYIGNNTDEGLKQSKLTNLPNDTYQSVNLEPSIMLEMRNSTNERGTPNTSTNRILARNANEIKTETKYSQIESSTTPSTKIAEVFNTFTTQYDEINEFTKTTEMNVVESVLFTNNLNATSTVATFFQDTQLDLMTETNNPEISTIDNGTVDKITEHAPRTRMNDTSITKFSEEPNILQPVTNYAQNITFNTTSTNIPDIKPHNASTNQNNETEFITITTAHFTENSLITNEVHAVATEATFLQEPHLDLMTVTIHPENSPNINAMVDNITEREPLTKMNDTSVTKLRVKPNISQMLTNNGSNTTSTIIPLKIPNNTSTIQNNETELTTIRTYLTETNSILTEATFIQDTQLEMMTEAINPEISPIINGPVDNITERAPRTKINDKSNTKFSEEPNISQSVTNYAQNIFFDITSTNTPVIKPHNASTVQNNETVFTTKTTTHITENSLITTDLNTIVAEATFPQYTHLDLVSETINPDISPIINAMVDNITERVLLTKMNDTSVSKLSVEPNISQTLTNYGSNTTTSTMIPLKIPNNTSTIQNNETEFTTITTTHLSEKSLITTEINAIVTEAKFLQDLDLMTEAIDPEIYPIINGTVDNITEHIPLNKMNNTSKPKFSEEPNISQPVTTYTQKISLNTTSTDTPVIKPHNASTFQNNESEFTTNTTAHFTENSSIPTEVHAVATEATFLQDTHLDLMTEAIYPEISPIINGTVYNFTEQTMPTKMNDTSKTKFSEELNISETLPNFGSDISLNRTFTMLPLIIPNNTSKIQKNETVLKTITSTHLTENSFATEVNAIVTEATLITETSNPETFPIKNGTHNMTTIQKNTSEFRTIRKVNFTDNLITTEVNTTVAEATFLQDTHLDFMTETNNTAITPIINGKVDNITVHAPLPTMNDTSATKFSKESHISETVSNYGSNTTSIVIQDVDINFTAEPLSQINYNISHKKAENDLKASSPLFEIINVTSLTIVKDNTTETAPVLNKTEPLIHIYDSDLNATRIKQNYIGKNTNKEFHQINLINLPNETYQDVNLEPAIILEMNDNTNEQTMPNISTNRILTGIANKMKPETKYSQIDSSTAASTKNAEVFNNTFTTQYDKINKFKNTSKVNVVESVLFTNKLNATSTESAFLPDIHLMTKAINETDNTNLQDNIKQPLNESLPIPGEVTRTNFNETTVKQVQSSSTTITNIKHYDQSLKYTTVIENTAGNNFITENSTEKILPNDLVTTEVLLSDFDLPMIPNNILTGAIIQDANVIEPSITEPATKNFNEVQKQTYRSTEERPLSPGFKNIMVPETNTEQALTTITLKELTLNYSTPPIIFTTATSTVKTISVDPSNNKKITDIRKNATEKMPTDKYVTTIVSSYTNSILSTTENILPTKHSNIGDVNISNDFIIDLKQQSNASNTLLAKYPEKETTTEQAQPTNSTDKRIFSIESDLQSVTNQPKSSVTNDQILPSTDSNSSPNQLTFDIAPNTLDINATAIENVKQILGESSDKINSSKSIETITVNSTISLLSIPDLSASRNVTESLRQSNIKGTTVVHTAESSIPDAIIVTSNVSMVDTVESKRVTNIESITNTRNEQKNTLKNNSTSESITINVSNSNEAVFKRVPEIIIISEASTARQDAINIRGQSDITNNMANGLVNKVKGNDSEAHTPLSVSSVLENVNNSRLSKGISQFATLEQKSTETKSPSNKTLLIPVFNGSIDALHTGSLHSATFLTAIKTVPELTEKNAADGSKLTLGMTETGNTYNISNDTKNIGLLGQENTSTYHQGVTKHQIISVNNTIATKINAIKPQVNNTKVNENSLNIAGKIMTNSVTFSCLNRSRGKYADNKDCRKYYICIGRPEPVAGTCPLNTVFSDINKQCTRNLSHCVRNNQFQCLLEGRFGDFLRDNIYYICVKNSHDHFVRFKLQCQNGYHLNKETVRCERNVEVSSSSTSSVSESAQKNNDNSESNQKAKENDNVHFECKEEGKFPYTGDCRKYYVCSKNGKSEYRRKIKLCPEEQVFNNERKQCVDSESNEC